MLNELLESQEGIETPLEHANAKHVYNQYTIKVKAGRMKRDELKEFLSQNEIGTSIYYPTPLSALETFASEAKAQQPNNPVSIKLSEQVLSIPVHPSVSQEDLQFIASKVKEFFKN